MRIVTSGSAEVESLKVGASIDGSAFCDQSCAVIKPACLQEAMVATALQTFAMCDTGCTYAGSAPSRGLGTLPWHLCWTQRLLGAATKLASVVVAGTQGLVACPGSGDTDILPTEAIGLVAMTFLSQPPLEHDWLPCHESISL